MARSLAALALVIALVGLFQLIGWAEPHPAAEAVAFFRKHTLAADEERLRELVTLLGSDSFEERQQASVTLATLGRKALPTLEKAAEDADVEVRNRAAVCVSAITTAYDPRPVVAASRTLAVHKPPEAATLLLDYAPQIVDGRAENAVIDALAEVAVRDGRADPVVVKALADGPPLRRAAAAVALARAGDREHIDAARGLLQLDDPDAVLRVGLALLKLKDKDALAALVGILDKVPRAELFEVEELLFRLAGETSPGVPYGTGVTERRRFREAWEAWWQDHGKNVDLTDRPPEFLDRTLVVLLDDNKVIDLDSEDRPRFELENLNFPLDAQYLPGDRILVAEHNIGRVSERHRSGTILWEKTFSGPLVAQRLPDGNTFMASKTQLLEVDRVGREVWASSAGENEEFMRAAKLPSGEIAVVVTERQQFRQRFAILDSRGKEKRNFSVVVSTFGGRLDVQADGRVLVPQRWPRQNQAQDAVVEFDAQGKSLREFRVREPIAAVRLDNGHTIVTSMTENRAVEFDAAGKEIWEFRSETSRVTRCTRR